MSGPRDDGRATGAVSSPLAGVNDSRLFGEFGKEFEKDRDAFGAWMKEMTRRAREDGRTFDPFVRFGDFFAVLIFIEQRGYFLFDAEDAESLFADIAAGADEEKYKASLERLLALNRAFVNAVGRLESRMLHLAPLSFKDKVVVRYRDHRSGMSGMRSWKEPVAGFGFPQIVLNLDYWMGRDAVTAGQEIEAEAARFMFSVLSRALGAGYMAMPRTDFKGYPPAMGGIINRMGYAIMAYRTFYDLLGPEAALGILWEDDMKVGIEIFREKGEVLTVFMSFAIFEALMALERKGVIRDTRSKIAIDKITGPWLGLHDDVIKTMAGKIKAFSERTLRDGEAVAMSIRLSAELINYFLSMLLRLADGAEGDKTAAVFSSSPVRQQTDAVKETGRPVNLLQEMLKDRKRQRRTFSETVSVGISLSAFTAFAGFEAWMLAGLMKSGAWMSLTLTVAILGAGAWVAAVILRGLPRGSQASFQA